MLLAFIKRLMVAGEEQEPLREAIMELIDEASEIRCQI
jgi:hypothetical protein